MSSRATVSWSQRCHIDLSFKRVVSIWSYKHFQLALVLQFGPAVGKGSIKSLRCALLKAGQQGGKHEKKKSNVKIERNRHPCSSQISPDPSMWERFVFLCMHVCKCICMFDEIWWTVCACKWLCVCLSVYMSRYTQHTAHVHIHVFTGYCVE